MSEVRDEACRKSGKRHTNFGLKSNNKAIDLSQTWRQCGLSPGAKLELIESSRTPSAVSVALQLPPTMPGGRLTDKVRSDTSLWHILRRFEKLSNINITQRGVASIAKGESGAGRIVYEMPSLNIAGRSAASFADLQRTLAQLGFNSGSVLIKLGFMPTEQPLEQAMAEIGMFFQEGESDGSSAAPTGTSTTKAASSTNTSIPNSTVDATPQLSQGFESSDMRSTNSEPLQLSVDSLATADPIAVGPSKRAITVFAAPTNDSPAAANLPHNDADYEPSIAQWERHEKQLASATGNKRLLSDAEEEALREEKTKKLESISEVKIKIRFPDQTVVLDTYTSMNTGADLYANVRYMIAADTQPFKLVYTDHGPKAVPDDKSRRLIQDLGFVGNVLVNLHWGDAVNAQVRHGPTLKQEYSSRAQKPPVPVLAEHAMSETKSGFDASKGKEAVAAAKDKVKGAMPKWFKGLGKK